MGEGRVRVARRTVRALLLLYHTPNLSQDSFTVSEDIAIPETQDGYTLFFESGGSSLVITAAPVVVVLSSIEFNDDLQFRTVEVQDAFPLRVLPS